MDEVRPEAHSFIVMRITVIVPLRLSEHLFEAEARLQRILATIDPDLYEVLIVDYGTPPEHRGPLDRLSGENVRVVRCDVEREPFSIGHARDVGAQWASSDVILFHDIDFYCTTSMYRRIHEEVESRNLAKNAYDFFCVPVFFLTEFGTISVLERVNDPGADLEIHRRLYEGQAGVTEFVAYGSSAMVVNRAHYLGLGGHSREFFGHGAEDYDVLHRLGAYYGKGPRTADYYTDIKSNQVALYRGFRAYFALYGLDVFAKGIFFVHLWHPKRTIPGYHQSSRNFSLLTELMRKFDRSREQPHPLSDLTRGTKALVLVLPNSSPMKAIRQALPHLGESEILTEDVFGSGAELVDYCHRHDIERVLFLNPYGNPHRLELYRSIRRAKIGFYVFDRGALPDSWFFDPGGFNFDSGSYAPSEWDREIEEAEVLRIDEYMSELRHGDATLEKNGGRRTARFLREHYGIGRRKVLFVPFQRPSDTVTTHFAGEADSVARFEEWVKYVARNLPKDEWVVLCKKHPLEASSPGIDGVIWVDDSTHVHDLLELADQVLLMNSGVGVLALSFLKPVICCSQAFYAHAGLAKSAESMGHALELVLNPEPVDRDKARRFLLHLVERVYSFGASEYRSSVAEDGSMRSVVYDIRFSTLRLPGTATVELGVPPRGVTLDAPLFSSFGGRSGVKAALAKKPVQAKPASPPTAAKKSQPTGAVKEVRAPSTDVVKKVRKLVRDPRKFFDDFVKKHS